MIDPEAVLFAVPLTQWLPSSIGELQTHALKALEAGKVLFFPQLAFPVAENEKGFLSMAPGAKNKNISFDVGTGKLAGSRADAAATRALRAMMQRFAQSAHDLVTGLLPHYADGLIWGRTSFRPVEVAGRPSSWRKDDTRLHIDSFPSTPVQGKRILRIFSNVNPRGQPRVWKLGEPFEAVARRFVPAIPAPAPGSSLALRMLHVTKSRRSAYDHFMLKLHDRMKADTEYQSRADQMRYEFPAGSTWMVFTDQVSHAALGGQCLLEQTFYVPVTAMMEPANSPLRALERLRGQPLT